MKLYKVYAEVTTLCYTEVKANSKEEALEKAEEIDGGDFYTDDSGTWKLINAKRVKN